MGRAGRLNLVRTPLWTSAINGVAEHTAVRAWIAGTVRVAVHIIRTLVVSCARPFLYTVALARTSLVDRIVVHTTFTANPAVTVPITIVHTIAVGMRSARFALRPARIAITWALLVNRIVVDCARSTIPAPPKVVAVLWMIPRLGAFVVMFTTVGSRILTLAWTRTINRIVIHMTSTAHIAIVRIITVVRVITVRVRLTSTGRTALRRTVMVTRRLSPLHRHQR